LLNQTASDGTCPLVQSLHTLIGGLGSARTDDFIDVGPCERLLFRGGGKGVILSFDRLSVGVVPCLSGSSRGKASSRNESIVGA